MTGNALNHGVQQPLFAPVSQQGAQLGDDIDLNEIFADYFINEFEDPLNAYTNSMANYSGAAAAVALAQKQQQVNQQQQQLPQINQHQNQQLTAAAPVAPTPTATHTAVLNHPGALAAAAPLLPTGGIRTMYHASTAPAPSIAATAMISQQHQHVPHPSSVTSSAAPSVAMPVVGAATTTAGNNGIVEPAVKKIRTALGPNNTSTMIAALPPNVARGAISGRLGFSMIGGQLALPQQQLQQQKQQTATPPQSQMTTMTSKQTSIGQTSASSGGISLPVGVGIRLGGIGGVAPATAAHRIGQYSMWSGAGGAGAGMGGPGGATGPMSDQQIAERRQRNREHAKRSRVRKKFMLESLQEQVRGLQKENVELRMIIQEKIPEKAQKIIASCCSKNSLFSDQADTSADGTTEDGQTSGKDPTALARSDFSLIESLTSGQQNFVLSDPRLPDNPIVYASPGFYVLTGYTQDQVLGRNCRFLQGPGTDPRAVDIIRKAIASGSDATTCILNYKADGTPFWNQFFVAALRDSDNCIVNYVGVQCEVETEAGSSALEDKVNSVLPLQNKDGETNTVAS